MQPLQQSDDLLNGTLSPIDGNREMQTLVCSFRNGPACPGWGFWSITTVRVRVSVWCWRRNWCRWRAFLAPHSQWLFSGEDHPGQVSCPTFRKANGRGVAAAWLCWAGPAMHGTRCWSARRCLAHGNMGAPSPYKQQLLAVRCLRAHTIQGKRGRLLSNLAPFPFLPFQLLLSFVLHVCGCLIWSYLQWQHRVLCLW